MKKLLALLMAGIMLLSFAACGGNEEEETTTDPEIVTDAPVNAEGEEATEEAIEGEVTEAEEETEVVTNAEGEEVTDAEGEAVTEKKEEEKTEKVTKKPESQKPAETAKNPADWSEAEIIDYCSKALDRVKSEKAGYTKNGHMVVKGDVKGLPSWLVSIFTKNELTTMAKGSNNKDDFPAAGYDWSCKLRPQDVQSATIKVSLPTVTPSFIQSIIAFGIKAVMMGRNTIAGTLIEKYNRLFLSHSIQFLIIYFKLSFI